MASPGHHFYGLGLNLDIQDGAGQRNIVAGDSYHGSGYLDDDTLDLFGDTVNIGMGYSDVEFQGMESVEFSQDPYVNSEIQQQLTAGQPQELPPNSSWDTEQRHADVNNSANDCYGVEEPISIYDFEQHHPQQPFVCDGMWEILSPSDPFWTQFLPYQGQAQTRQIFETKETNETKNGDGATNAYKQQKTTNDVNNGFNSGFASQVLNTQTNLSYIDQGVLGIGQLQQINFPLIQGKSAGVIGEQLSPSLVQEHNIGSSQRTLDSTQHAGDDVLILQDPKERDTPPAKRRKTNGGSVSTSSQKVGMAKSHRIGTRTSRRINLDPTLYYQPLKNIPQSWGVVRPDGRHTFRYNSFGELIPEMTLTTSEMSEYLYGKFQLLTGNEPSGPVLLIQCVPSDSNSRYPSPLSSKCRFKECPVKTRTIPLGHFRVAFDEQNSENVDPFHCAGFVHLYCLERFCNFGFLAQYYNVSPDVRQLREGRNRMAITRDHTEFARMCRVYIENAKYRDPHADGWDYRNTLCSLLTDEYFRLESRVRRRTRERLGGNNIGVHKNDMELYAQGEEKKGLRSRERLLKKRKREYTDDVEDSGEHDGQGRGGPGSETPVFVHIG